MLRLRLAAVGLLLCLAHAAALAQSYTSLVIFGDSLSDTGNIARLVQNGYTVRYPGPLFNYADGRFTDSTSTTPAATVHAGVWVEQLAALFPAHPAVIASLDGGTNYAYGDATTATSTTTITETTGVSITLNNIGQQVADYLAAHPTVPAGTLVIVWGGANDLGSVVTTTTSQQAQTIINTAVTNEVSIVQRLITAGATDILVPNLPPLGLLPRFNTDAALSPLATAGAQAFNSGLQAGLASLPAANPGVALRLFQLDTFALFNSVAASPSTFALTNISGSAQGQAGVNPDQYLFWDSLHPSTTGHALLAAAAEVLLTPAPVSATTTTVSSSALTSNQGSSVTLTATVTGVSGSPTGTVTFLDRTTTLGTATLAAAGATTGTATLAISTLTAGPHTITASYAGTTGFAASTSVAITQTVVAPALTATLSPDTLTLKRGAGGNASITLTPVGGFTGSVTITCGTTPPQTFCASGGLLSSFADGTPRTATVNITTNGVPPPVPAAVLLPLLGLGGFLALRRSRLRIGLLVLFAALSSAGLLGLSGCGGSSRSTPAGTYTIPITVAPSTGASTTLTLTLVIQ